MEAMVGLRAAGMVRGMPLQNNVAAISVGIVGKQELLDWPTKKIRAPPSI
jgi:ribonuclease PH